MAHLIKANHIRLQYPDQPYFHKLIGESHRARRAIHALYPGAWQSELSEFPNTHGVNDASIGITSAEDKYQLPRKTLLEPYLYMLRGDSNSGRLLLHYTTNVTMLDEPCVRFLAVLVHSAEKVEALGKAYEEKRKREKEQRKKREDAKKRQQQARVEQSSSGAGDSGGGGDDAAGEIQFKKSKTGSGQPAQPPALLAPVSMTKSLLQNRGADLVAIRPC